MKKGFTLVELLAVIVILAVILAITIPSITNLIDTSRLNSFNADSKILERAAKTYLSVNDISVALNSTTEISYSDIKNAGYINTIVDPVSKEECIHSRVYVTNTNGILTYKSALVCNNYMDIDAYNLFTNGDFSNGTTGWGSNAGSIRSENDKLIVYNPNATYPGFVQSNINIGASKVFYLSFNYYTPIQTLNIRPLWGSSNSGSVYTGNISPITSNLETSYSILNTTPSNYGGYDKKFYLINYISSTFVGDVCTVDNIVLLDLTSIYGDGNEPTKTQMDTIINNMGK